MDRDRLALVLEQHAGRSVRETQELEPRLVQSSGSGRVPAQVPAGVASLQTVQPRGGPLRWGEQPVDLGDRATADQSDGTLERTGHLKEQRAQRAIDVNGIRGTRKLEQCAVYVEEQAP